MARSRTATAESTAVQQQTAPNELVASLKEENALLAADSLWRNSRRGRLGGSGKER